MKLSTWEHLPMENFETKLHDEWMENAAGVPKVCFSVRVGCRVLQVSGINDLGRIMGFKFLNSI